MTEPTRSPVALVARRLDCTEGQVFTMLIGLVIALLLAVPGIPAVLRDRSAREPTPAALRPLADGGTSGASASPAAPPSSVPPPSATGGSAVQRLGPLPSSGSTPPAPTRRVALPPSGSAPSPRAPVPGTIGTFARVGPPGAPGGLAVASDGTVFVTTDNGSARGGRGPSRVFSYDADGTPSTDRAVDGQPDDRTGGLTGAAVDPSTGDPTVLDPEGARILSLDMASGTQSVLATIPDLPACLVSLGAFLCQPGLDDREPFPVSAVYDAHGNLFLTDPAQDTIWRLHPDARAPEIWFQSVYFSAGDGPYGLAITGGAVELTVGSSNDVAAFGSGALYRLTIDPEGDPGDLTLVHAFEDGDRPGSLALGSSGTAYVVLRDSGAIVTIAPDGSQTGRIDPPGMGPIPLDAPSAVALVPGALLVANGRTSDDPAHWAVLTVAIDDRPTMAAAARSDRHRTAQPRKVA